MPLKRLAATTVLAIALWGCAHGKHGDIIDVKDIPSPDGRYVCTEFGETFYDTTGYRRHIYLRPVGRQRGYPGNVYVVPVGEDVAVSWTTPTNLSVRLGFESPRPLPDSTNVFGVKVTFFEAPR